MAKKWKRPWMKFDTGDWLGDAAVQSGSPASRGALINLLSHMDRDDTYFLTRKPTEFARLTGCTSLAEWEAVLAEFARHETLTVTARDELVTLISRRLEREYKARQDNAKRQERFREKRYRSGIVTGENIDHENIDSTPLPPKTSLSTDAACFMAAWNSIAEAHDLPTIRSITSKRKVALKARLSDADWRTSYTAALAEIPRRPFLLGKNDRGWRATADWFLRPDSVTKILEGHYADSPNHTPRDDRRAF